MLPTYWKKGRRDYQILYVASGKAHFWFNGIEEIVDSGHMVLYKPKEVQKYVYYVEDHPEVFWIHFTGYDVKNILEYHGISLNQHVFTVEHCRNIRCRSENYSGTSAMRIRV